MNTLTTHFALAGLCFGAYPLFMNKNGLSGNLSGFVLVLIVTICVFPFALNEFKNIVNANWTMAISAGVLSAIGMIFFAKGLSKATTLEVSSLFVTMIVVQAIVPVIYKAIINGITIKQFLGFISAIIAVVLLN